MRVSARLDVKGDDVRPRMGEVLYELLGVGYHQVHIHRNLAAAPQLGDDWRADGDVRREMAVHHIDMDHVRSSLDHLFYFLCESTEIRRKQGRRNLYLAQRIISLLCD
jgi:hypothetical protein